MNYPYKIKFSLKPDFIQKLILDLKLNEDEWIWYIQTNNFTKDSTSYSFKGVEMVVSNPPKVIRYDGELNIPKTAVIISNYSRRDILRPPITKKGSKLENKSFDSFMKLSKKVNIIQD